MRRTLIDLSGIFFTYEIEFTFIGRYSSVHSPLIWFIGLDSIVQVGLPIKKVRLCML